MISIEGQIYQIGSQCFSVCDTCPRGVAASMWACQAREAGSTPAGGAKTSIKFKAHH